MRHSSNDIFQSLQTCLEEESTLRQCLMPIVVEQSTTLSRNTSESLIRNLLSIDQMQPKLITYLLERLPEFYDELEENSTSTSTVRMILHQLRWLEYIVEAENLTDKLVEVMQVTPQAIQHEMISALPDIVNDSEHKGMVATLTTMMQNNQELVAPILDALSNFNLLADDLDDIRDTMLNQLDTANMSDLPMIMRFLLQTATAEKIEDVILKIRQKLDFKALAKVQAAEKDVVSFRPANAPVDKGMVPEALVLESIKIGLQFHKFISDAWIKVINDKESPSGYKIIDVLVLFTMYSMPPTKKKVEQIVKKKIISKVLSIDLITETISQHAEGINSLWMPILSLAEALLRTNPNQPLITKVSSAIYKNAFKMCNTYYRQEIIGIIVTHIGSGTFSEIDAGLKTLLEVVNDDPESISPFVAFIKGVLDYLDKLEIDQIGALFDIFSRLALEPHGRVSDDRSIMHLMSDMQIIIRKQLSNPQEKYKKIGIIGALSVVKALGSPSYSREVAAGSGSAEVSSSQVLRHPTLQQAKVMLETVFRSCAGYSACLALAYDELCHMIAQKMLDQSLVLWLQDTVTTAVPDTYMFDSEELQAYIDGREENLPLKPETWFNLDGEDSQITLKLFRLIEAPDESTDRQHKKYQYPAATLCPIFNLLQACEKVASDGCLDAIDALLGCGIMLYDTDQPVERMDVKSRECACNTLFYAINWLREITNAFCDSEDESTVQKLVTRLNNIVELEKMLMRMLACTPSFSPQGYTLKAGMDDSSSKDSNAKKGLTIGSQANKKVGATGSDDSETESVISTSRSTKKPSRASAMIDDISSLHPLMRELKFDTLRILNTGSHELLRFPLKLSGFNYLVTDLQAKLKKTLSPPTLNPFFAKKKKDLASLYIQLNISYLQRMTSKDVVEQTLPHLPTLLDRWESISLNGDEDENTTETEAQQSIGLILDVLHQLLTWPELQDTANENIKRSLLCVLAVRSDKSINRLHDLQRLIRCTFNYLSKFSTTLKKGEATVQLHKALTAVVSFVPDSTLTAQVHKSAESILRKEWSDAKDMKKHIVYLVEQEIHTSDAPLDIIHGYLSKTFPAFDNGDADELESHPLLTKDTLHLYYQALAGEVVSAQSNFKENQETDDNAILELSRIINCFELMTAYIKAKDDRALLSVILKSGRLFIEQMTKRTISYLSSHFKTHRDAVINMLKQFQNGTRTLQIICSHVKIIQDIQLSSHVPSLKKALEIVIYQAKALLTDNNAPANAFFLGALKHRDITGAEVSSQIPIDSSDESEDEQQLASDDNEEASPEPMPQTTTPEHTRKVVRNPQAKRVRPVISTVPVIRSSSRVPTSDDESDEEMNLETRNHGQRAAENIPPVLADTSPQLSPVSETNTGTPLISREGSENHQDPPRKKRKLGTGLSRRTSHPPLHHTNL
ncbi:unnamed protein product [Umbelopsis ramanniana]